MEKGQVTRDTQRTDTTRRQHATTARKLAVPIATAIAITLSQAPCTALATTSVSDTKAAFDDAAQKYDDACTASEQAQQAADNAVASLEQAKADAVTSIRSTYKNGSNDTINAIMSALCSGNIADGIKELTAWQSIAEWADTNIQTLVSDKAAADQAKADADTAVSDAQAARDAAEQAYDAALKEQKEAQKKAAAAASSSSSSSSGVASTSIVTSGDSSSSGDGYLTVSQLKFRGVVYYDGWRITYYSQSVLPGGGLDIPGRHVEDGFVCDSDGRISVACSTLPKGTIVKLPFVNHTEGVVRDSGCAAGTIDIYTS